MQQDAHRGLKSGKEHHQQLPANGFMVLMEVLRANNYNHNNNTKQSNKTAGKFFEKVLFGQNKTPQFFFLPNSDGDLGTLNYGIGQKK